MDKERKKRWLQVRIEPTLRDMFAARCRYLHEPMGQRVRALIAEDCGDGAPEPINPAIAKALADAIDNPAGVPNHKWDAWAKYLRTLAEQEEPA